VSRISFEARLDRKTRRNFRSKHRIS